MGKDRRFCDYQHPNIKIMETHVANVHKQPLENRVVHPRTPKNKFNHSKARVDSDSGEAIDSVEEAPEIPGRLEDSMVDDIFSSETVERATKIDNFDGIIKKTKTAFSYEAPPPPPYISSSISYVLTISLPIFANQKSRKKRGNLYS